MVLGAPDGKGMLQPSRRHCPDPIHVVPDSDIMLFAAQRRKRPSRLTGQETLLCDSYYLR